MPTPDTIHTLVDRFRANLDSYKRGTVGNETQVRREFSDPFFEALGWDVANRQGYAEACKDVVHEDAIKVSGGTKAPDYGFSVGGVRKFFVEAKKPSVDVKGDPHPAYQLRRYAWSAKLPLSVLTDFEEFARHDRMVSLVTRTAAGVELHQRVAAEQTPHQRVAAEQTPHVKTVLQRHAEGGCDRQTRQRRTHWCMSCDRRKSP